MRTARLPRTQAAAPSRGVTLVELMVGLALGLIVVSAALSWTGHSLGVQMRQQRGWQLHQELRALILPLQLELRRAGAHGRPSQLVWKPEAVPSANLFTPVTLADNGGTLRFSRAAELDQSVPDPSSEVAFRWTDGRLDQWIGQRFQPMTDPALLQLSSFQAQLETTAHAGARACADTVWSRTAHLRLQAHSTADPALTQVLGVSVHLRNDQVAGGCP